MIKLITKDNGALNLAQKLAKGDDGGYYIPQVDADGNLTWTPSETEMPAVDSANVKGGKGDRGESGVYVGNDEPTDPNVLIWLVPTGKTSDFVMTEKEVKNYIDTSLEEVERGYY
jgi:hypothetical protein